MKTMKTTAGHALRFALATLVMAPLQTHAETYYFNLTPNSYYSYSYEDFGTYIVDRREVTGALHVVISPDGTTVTLDYGFLFAIDSEQALTFNSLRGNDILRTDAAAVATGQLIAGNTGEPSDGSDEPGYQNYGNALLLTAVSAGLCLECSYEMRLNLDPTALVLSYQEYNPYGTGRVTFEFYVSEVPLPASVWLFGGGLLGLMSAARRRRG